MTKQAPILETSMTETGGPAASVIRASDLFGYWSLVLGHSRDRSMARRRGLSLLEVILAIAILGMALATIGQLIRIGSRNAIMARDLATAQLYCESTMNEVAAGAIEPTSGSGPLDDLGEWTYDLTVESTDQENMLSVKVVVAQDTEQYARPVTFTMTRWLIDPAFVEQAAAEEAAMKEAFAAAQKAATSTQSTATTGLGNEADMPATDPGALGGVGGVGGLGGVGGQQGGQGQGGRGGRGGQGGQGGQAGGQGGRGGQGGGTFGGQDGGGQRGGGQRGGGGGQPGGGRPGGGFGGQGGGPGGPGGGGPGGGQGGGRAGGGPGGQGGGPGGQGGGRGR
jgi:type II secretion system protein I